MARGEWGPIGAASRVGSAGPGAKNGVVRTKSVAKVGAFFALDNDDGKRGELREFFESVKRTTRRECVTTFPVGAVVPFFKKRNEVFFTVTVVANNVTDNVTGSVAVGMVLTINFLVLGRGDHILPTKDGSGWPKERDTGR